MNNVVPTIEPAAVQAPNPALPAAIPTAAHRPGRTRQIAQSSWRWTKLIFNWIPLSLRGVLVATALSVAIPWYAQARRDQIVLGMAVCGLGVIGFLILNVLVTALYLRFARKVTAPPSAITLDTGYEAVTGFDLGVLAANPLIRVDIIWDDPAGVEADTIARAGHAIERITPRRRGEYTRVARRIRVADVLGLGRIVFVLRENRTLLIRPACSTVRHIEMPIQLKAGEDFPRPEGAPEGDLVDLRKYGPGDPLKRILWKTFARTGRLVARQPEKALAPTRRVLAYLVAGEQDEPSAGLLRSAVEGGWFGENYRVGADGVDEVASEPTGALRIVVRSLPTADASRGIVRLLHEGDVPACQSLIAFVPATPGLWLEPTAAALRTNGQGHAAIIGVDGPPVPAPGPWQRIFFRTRAQGPTTAQLLQVKKTLQEAGVNVQIIDRTSGDTLPLEANHD